MSLGRLKSAASLRPDSTVESGAARAPTPQPVDENDIKRPRASAALNAVLRDNGALIAHQPLEAARKFDKLAASPLAFFRGTTGLFYRHVRGLDANQPHIVINGDVHPLNFGVLERKDGTLVFGLNDVDEASRGPFSWDLRRGLAAFALAARDRSFSADTEQAVMQAMLDGYRGALQDIDAGKRKPTARFSAKSAPPVIADILKRAQGRSRQKFLDARVNAHGCFHCTKDIVPQRGVQAEFQTALQHYRFADGRVPVVRDVALKFDSGTGSMGLRRYYVLVEGPPKREKAWQILEVKYEQRSAPASIGGRDVGSPGERVAEAFHLLAPQGVLGYGAVSLSDGCYIVRERSHHKETVNLERISASQLVEYARACGSILAQAHARSGQAEGVSVKQLLSALDKKLRRELLAFGTSEAVRIESAYHDFVAAFQRDRFGLP